MKNVFYIMLAMFIAIQFIPAKIKNYPIESDLEIKAPDKIVKIFQRACYDCHSNKATIPWYQAIAPFSFGIKRHIDLGRQWLNFSIWKQYSKKEKDKKLEEIFRAVYSAMPLQSYLWLHPKAKLTQKEIKMIRDWTGKAPY